MKNIFAYTQPQATLPTYVSLNEHFDGSVWLTVRGRRGSTSNIELDEERLMQLATAIGSYLKSR